MLGAEVWHIPAAASLGYRDYHSLEDKDLMSALEGVVPSLKGRLLLHQRTGLMSRTERFAPTQRRETPGAALSSGLIYGSGRSPCRNLHVFLGLFELIDRAVSFASCEQSVLRVPPYVCPLQRFGSRSATGQVALFSLHQQPPRHSRRRGAMAVSRCGSDTLVCISVSF